MIKEDTPYQAGILLSSFPLRAQALLFLGLEGICLFKKQPFFIYNNYILLAPKPYSRNSLPVPAGRLTYAHNSSNLYLH